MAGSPILKPSEKNSPKHARQMSTIVDKKQTRFECLKQVIRSGLQTAFEVGAALFEIRESKLYQKEFETFEAFCESEFKIVRSRAYQLIEAAQIKASLPPAMSTMVDNEGQVRALAPVPEEKRVEVLEETAKTGPVTAKRITETAAKITTPKAKSEKPIHLDKTGYPIPESILAEWQRAEAFNSNLREISRIKSEVSKGLDDKDPIFRELSSSTISALTNLYGELKCVLPYAVCTSCSGKIVETCSFCRGRGFLSEFVYKQVVSNDAREFRQKIVSAK